jgi:hypothetical protein
MYFHVYVHGQILFEKPVVGLEHMIQSTLRLAYKRIKITYAEVLEPKVVLCPSIE